MKHLVKIFFCLVVALAVAGPFFVAAESGGEPYNPPNLPINPNLPLTNAVPISGPQGQGPAGVIANFYSFAFLVAGFLAFVMIVYGGVRYTFSAGNHSWKEEGKEAIRQALFGLGLLLVAYLILRTINPDLTNLRLPTLTPYNPPAFSGGDITDACGGCPVGSRCVSTDGETAHCDALGTACPDAAPLSPLSSDAQLFENGQTLVWNSQNADVQRNLTKLKEEVGKLILTVQGAGGRASVSSAYRSLSYQRHFWEICDRKKKLANNAKPECAALKQQVEAEFSKHRINSACTVANPDSCAPHVMGRGVDLSITGLSQAQVNNLIQQRSIELRHQNLPGDEFHYNLVNPPYTGCRY